jgi:quaternary ammonium compound-resistance protein SugE
VRTDRSWLYIVIGGVFEVIWAVAMKYSDGLTDIGWSAVAIVFIVLSMIALSKAVAAGLPLGTAYTVWVGIGAAGTFICGVLFMDEHAGILRILFLVMIIVGIAGSQLTMTKKIGD